MICLLRDSPGLLKKLSVNGDRRFLVSWYFFKKIERRQKKKYAPNKNYREIDQQPVQMFTSINLLK